MSHGQYGHACSGPVRQTAVSPQLVYPTAAPTRSRSGPKLVWPQLSLVWSTAGVRSPSYSPLNVMGGLRRGTAPEIHYGPYVWVGRGTDTLVIQGRDCIGEEEEVEDKEERRACTWEEAKRKKNKLPDFFPDQCRKFQTRSWKKTP